MSQALSVDLRELVLSNTTFGPQEIEQIQQTVAEDFSAFRVFRDAVQQLETKGELTPAEKTRLGVCQYLLGRFPDALETLSHADGGALAQFYKGRTLFALGRYDEALEAYQAAAKAGYDADQCALARAEALRYQGRAEEALKVLDRLSGAVEQTAEYLYQRGATVAVLGGSRQEVIALYQRAVEADPNHPGALFGLALECDRYGDDEEAMRLLERAVQRIPAHVGALLNLGILYEDHEQYERAQRCYERILEVYPNHPKARLYYKDAVASQSQLYDEEAQRRQDRLAQVLSIPISDFELSVRSRNCLQRLGIHTLGDLTRITEQQLLASKNFGETSLVEIREIMRSKGLQIGQFAHQAQATAPGMDTSALSPEKQSLLARPVTELNLSVRAKRCMNRLGITTIGELIQHTGDQLLECKNFGITSLNEVREKLAALGLKLRGD